MTVGEHHVAGIVFVLRLLFRIQVIQVAEELVEAVVRRQMLVLVAQVILAELARRVALRLQQRGDRRVFLLQAEIGAGKTDLRQPGAEYALTGDV